MRDAAAALRIDDLNFSLDGLHLTPGSLLAVDDASFASTAYWRDDLGALTLPPSPDLPTVGVPLPAGTAKIGAWLRLDELIIDPRTGVGSAGLPLIANLFDDITVFARLRDANGTFQQVQLIPQRVEGVADSTDLSAFAYDDNPFASPETAQAARDRLQAALEGVSGWVYFEGEIDRRGRCIPTRPALLAYRFEQFALCKRMAAAFDRGRHAARLHRNGHERFAYTRGLVTRA